MVQRLIYIVVVLLLCEVSVALTQELKPEEGFKGVRWGASVEEMKTVFTNASAKPIDSGRPRETTYFVGSNIGATHVDLNLVFLDGKFARAFMVFDRGEFDQVTQVFKERYGQQVMEAASGLTWTIGDTRVAVLRAGAAVVTTRAFDTYDNDLQKRR
jgi:hypothetical protein